MKNNGIFIPLLILISYILPAQSLKLEEFMKGEEFIGFSPTSPFWSPDSKFIYFNWKKNKSLFSYALAEGQIDSLSKEVEKNIPSANGVFNKDQSLFAYEKNGDLYLFNVTSGKINAVTATQERESSPQFSGDQQSLVFRKGDNLFSFSLKDNALVQLSFFGAQTPSSPPKSSQKDWLEKDQLQLFQVLAERNQDELDNKIEPIYKTTDIGKKRVLALHLSPDLRYVSVLLVTPAAPDPTMMPDFVTQSGYTEPVNTRSKVGSAADLQELGIYDRERDSFYLVPTDFITGIKDKPAFLQEYHNDSLPYSPQYKNPRKVFFSSPVFSEDGKAIVVIRSQDNKDRWIMTLNMEDGSLKLLDRQRDEAWIGGPGISGWGSSGGNLGWLDNDHLFFQSEQTGYSHLYSINVNNGIKNQLTQGLFEIRSAVLSEDKSRFYIIANAENPYEHHFYHLPVSGGNLLKITRLIGGHQVRVSPDEKNLAILYSYANQPWELFTMPNEPEGVMVQITESTTENFRQYAWRDPEIVQFKASDGAMVSARLYRPKSPQKQGPAVIFVHGAGYLQNVHKWWSSYFREYMFHNFLADQGYTVLDIDYRGSDGYGRDWRTGIYRFMGGKDLSDQVDGAAYLASNWNVNPSKIGIYGGSYGGFITLMGLFTAPDVFACGAALRSVTDWAHYNHPYTSNILNTPVEDSIAYKRSSPIYHAEGLKNHLLMLHGMVDRNVHFQDIVRLSQRLIELEKDNWELAVYPVEDHGFVESSSWIDEYKRIYKLFSTHLKP
jgi:dipeptidyl aminopeptidase/acylaminoacyl peptidase